MSRRELLIGSAVLVVVTIGGLATTARVDRHFAAVAAAKGDCVRDGWKHWPWPNAPTLPPKCTQTGS